jgi:hypothetical protein
VSLEMSMPIKCKKSSFFISLGFEKDATKYLNCHRNPDNRSENLNFHLMPVQNKPIRDLIGG